MRRWGKTGVVVAICVGLGACSSPVPAPTEPVIVGVVTCSSDADCDNGLPCDGAELCEQNFCLVGQPVNCNDNVGCTTDVCSNELGGECLHLPRDADFDGHADISCVDDGGEALGDDCDDLDSNQFPGNLEVCDALGHDEDCDSSSIGGVDVDGDGFIAARCCNGSNCGNDCDDLRFGVNPQGQELCDNIDNDCNDSVDEGLKVTMYQDADGDQHGDPAVPLQLCAQSAHASLLADDCDDDDITIHPAQVEICDGKNNDCDGVTDEDTPQVTSWWPDADGDRFGNPAGPVVQSCIPPADHALNDRDCDDTAPAISPVAPELCDSVDNDCNGLEDYQIPGQNNDFEDDDADGLVDGQCVGGEDCDDEAAETGPGSLELCDGRDNDCDDEVDEHAANSLWFKDTDTDGVGSTLSGVRVSCEAQPGYSQEGGDCDDSDAAVFPGQFEICDNDDQDCDGVADNDIDFNAPEHCGDCQTNCTLLAHSDNSCTSGHCNCDDDYADCNGQRADGCEADLNNSWINCGSCGNACVTANGVAECVAGACEVIACVPGYAECQGNGCEPANLVTRCGDCTNCNNTLQNVNNKSCNAGQCDYATCTGDYGDCDNNRGNGCETGLAANPDDCGACGVDCNELPGTTGACTSNLCQCASLHGSCDGINANGCETDFRAITTCGNDCGSKQNCSVANQHGSPFCTGGGACGVVCDDHWGNCDSNLSCETQIGTVQNCGCGVNCTAPGQANGIPLCIQENATDYECATLCNFGWQDCDAEPRDCETNVATDEDNCGTCGFECTGIDTCNAGTCADGGSSGGGGGNNLLAIDVAVGADFTCALTEANAVYCWGGNDHGQLGDNTTDPHHLPALVDTANIEGIIEEIYAGAYHACLVENLLGFRTLFCWGDNSYGQLGIDPSNGDQLRPFATVVAVIGDRPRPVALGAFHSCAVTPNEEMDCWGDNSKGQLGRGPLVLNPHEPDEVDPQVPSKWFLPTAGMYHTCAVDKSSGAAVGHCWGANESAQLTNVVPVNENSIAFVPVALPAGLEAIIDFAAGGSHTCVLNGLQVKCWGDNTLAQVQPDLTGTSNPVEVPFLISPTGVIDDVSAFQMHTCARNTINQMICWGRNEQGQLGRGTVSPSPDIMAAVQVTAPVAKMAASSALASHTCAIDNQDRVWCWGFNYSGQVGLVPGSMTGPMNQPNPFIVQLPPPDNP